MLFGFWYYDWTLLMLIPGFIFSLWAQIKVKSTFGQYSKKTNSKGFTGAEAAETVLHMNGIYDVQVIHIRGELNDHYSPKERVIRLSDNVYASSSIAAVGVAAHEAGHAVQYAKGYGAIKFRMALVPVANIGSGLAMPIFIIGLIMASDALLLTGIILFSLAVLFQLVTLPVEIDASNRAVKAIRNNGLLSPSEQDGAKKVLSAAAMTYVAAMVASLLSLLRLILIANNNRRR